MIRVWVRIWDRVRVIVRVIVAVRVRVSKELGSGIDLNITPLPVNKTAELLSHDTLVQAHSCGSHSVERQKHTSWAVFIQ